MTLCMRRKSNQLNCDNQLILNELVFEMDVLVSEMLTQQFIFDHLIFDILGEPELLMQS